jgi:hypothetical protein
VRGSAVELLEDELLDRLGGLAVGQPQQEPGQRQSEIARLLQAAQNLPRSGSTGRQLRGSGVFPRDSAPSTPGLAAASNGAPAAPAIPPRDPSSITSSTLSWNV